MTERPASSRAQVFTAVFAGAAALGVAVAAVVSVGMSLYVTAVGESLNSAGEALDEVQALKEAVCVPYVNGVLELAAQGYTAEQIEAAHVAAAVAPADSQGWDDDTPSQLIDYCGNPAEILAGASAEG